MLFAKVFTMGVLALILIQDIKDRAVYWILFPLLMSALLLIRIHEPAPAGLWFYTTIFNILLIGLQILLLTAFFSLKNRRFTNITSGLLGWGDILFLLSITVYFSLLNYLFFYVISLLATIVLWLLVQQMSNRKSLHIPLAGFQSAFLLLFLSAEWWFHLIDLADDEWLVNLIKK